MNPCFKCSKWEHRYNVQQSIEKVGALTAPGLSVGQERANRNLRNRDRSEEEGLVQ